VPVGDATVVALVLHDDVMGFVFLRFVAEECTAVALSICPGHEQHAAAQLPACWRGKWSAHVNRSLQKCLREISFYENCVNRFEFDFVFSPSQ
jgi:hypothetical protein